MAFRPRPAGPDALPIDGKMTSFVGEKEREPDMAKTSITMNRFAIVDQVLFDQVVPVEILFRQLFATVKRIGKPVIGRAFRKPPRGVGVWPNLHDVMRWLDSLDDSDEKAEEVAFLFKLYNTAKGRVRPELLAKLESGKGSDEHALV